MHFFARTQKTYGASADLLTDRAAFGERGAFAALELVAAQHVDRRARLHGFRTRLQDVQLAVDAILAPLDVHRPAVVLLDDEGLGGERSEEHTSELQSLMRISYAVFCLKKKNSNIKHTRA